MTSTAFITHRDCQLHDMGSYHPEAPDRLTAISDHMIAQGLDSYFVYHDAPLATFQQLHRVHSAAHLERLTFIRHCRNLDMTLGEIRTLLHFKASPEENCGEVNRLLDEHIEHVVRRIGELQELERQLRDLRGCCPDGRQAAACGILEGLSQPSLEKASGNHVPGVHESFASNTGKS